MPPHPPHGLRRGGWSKPFCSAKAIWPAVTGEHEPETQATALGRRGAETQPSALEPAARHGGVAYSTPASRRRGDARPRCSQTSGRSPERLVVDHVEGHDLGAQRPLSIKARICTLAELHGNKIDEAMDRPVCFTRWSRTSASPSA